MFARGSLVKHRAKYYISSGVSLSTQKLFREIWDGDKVTDNSFNLTRADYAAYC